MGTQTTKPKGGNITYHYYVCNRRRQLRKMCECTQRSLAAAKVEAVVWEVVSSLLQDPEKIRVGMAELIEEEQATRTADPEREAMVWMQKIAECDRLRAAYQDQQAAGYMTLDELGSKLKELEVTRKLAQVEFRDLLTRKERIEELKRDRDALLESYAEMVPKTLHELSGEERNWLYGMLRLEVTPTQDGFEVAGAFCTSGFTSTAT